MGECPNCNTRIESGGKFCPECGEKLQGSSTKYCAECGGEIEEGAKFCPDCGSSIESQTPTKEESKTLSKADTYALVGAGLIMVTVLMPWGWNEGWIIREPSYGSIYTKSGRSNLGILPTISAIATGLIAYSKDDGEYAGSSLTGSWGTDIAAFGVVITLYSLVIFIAPQMFIPYDDGHAGFPIFLLFLGGVLTLYAGLKKRS